MPSQNRSDLLFPIRRIEHLLSDDPLQMRRFCTFSLTPGGTPFGRLPGATNLLPLCGIASGIAVTTQTLNL
ncbi:MAG TPA: hypothetical protein VFC67_04185 [Prolixibacteraceae bacterium]|nr:hypothetical protein [Prolixibacteraceae bacterium]